MRVSACPSQRLTQYCVGYAAPDRGSRGTTSARPQIIAWHQDFYMIPESSEANSIRLYRAEEFPGQWRFVKTLLPGYFTDPSVFR